MEYSGSTEYEYEYERTQREKLPFYGLREVVLGLVRSTSRVRTYLARKRRFFGMIPSQRLEGRFRGL